MEPAMSVSPKDHWIVLRVTALAAVPMCVWFIFSIVQLVGADHATFMAWLKNPMNAWTLISFVMIICYHAMLGCHEILEDYVHNEALLKFSMFIKTFLFFFVGVVCIYAVAKMALLI
jgi:succinate dehydrogenase / fumarate reductase membrane anchor subunit